MTKPLCFVLMPFGTKPDGSGGIVDFDAVYRELIAPAIVDADLEALRADEEVTGGIIHKPMFEQLILCEFAVADLTTANANVFYELGVRHAVRPWSHRPHLRAGQPIAVRRGAAARAPVRADGGRHADERRGHPQGTRRAA